MVDPPFLFQLSLYQNRITFVHKDIRSGWNDGTGKIQIRIFLF